MAGDGSERPGPGSLTPTSAANLGLIFQAGKTGDGYLLRADALGGYAGQLYSTAICPGEEAIGATAYDANTSTVYVPCTRSLIAVHLTGGSSPSFSANPLITGLVGDPGGFAPMIAAGAVWEATPGARLYGFDLSTGRQLANLALPLAPTHFGVPSYGAGALYIPSGAAVVSVSLSGATGAATSTPTPSAGPPTATATSTPTSAPGSCPCTLFPNTAAPASATGNDSNSVEVGVKFFSDTTGYISGVRFYKLSVNTGPHVGSLWTSSGTLLASATFTGESAYGWQQVNFATPVAISANTTYVASYHANGHYAADVNYYGASGVDSPPLHASAGATVGGNGVYAYSSTTTFPTNTYNASNYWVDVVFTPPAPTATATSTSTPTPTLTPTSTPTSTPTPTSSPTPTGTPTSTPTSSPTPTWTATSAPPLADTATPTPTATSTPSAGGGGCPCTIFPSSAAPSSAIGRDPNSVEVGVKFRSDIGGFINAIRFYKLGVNTGTHIGSLWDSSGTLLATATFSDETASGWQEVNFATPVPIFADTTYVASYHSSGHYGADPNYFSTAGVDWAPLHAPASGAVGGNGVFVYSTSTTFPTSSYNASNYWVDVVFSLPAPTPTPTATATATSTSTPTSTLTPTATPTPNVLTFDAHPAHQPLNGEYPSGQIDWGSGQWYVAGPWGAFTGNSISFPWMGPTSASFSFVSPRVLVSLRAYNGGTTPSTVTLACSGNPTVTQQVPSGQLLTIATDWASPCSNVSIGSSNSWWTNFDSVTYTT